MADSQRKTANLWDENMSDISSSMTYKPLYVGNNVVTMSSNIPQTSQGFANLFLKRGRADSGATTGDNGVWDGNPRTFEPIDGYVTVAYRNANGVNPQDYNIMLNEGATAKPYEPYGWVHSLRKLTTVTEAVENPLYSDGTAITAYTLKGNTVQTGTPSPQNPVMPNGVGERTENLFDKSNPNELNAYFSGGVIYEANGYKMIYIPCEPNTEYTVSKILTYRFSIAQFDQLPTYGSSNLTNIYRNNDTEVTLTTEPTAAYLVVFLYTPQDTVSLTDIYNSLMINKGKPRSYEPYGYKIPISNGGATTNIYLGSTQTVRQIKKYEFTGQESWGVASGAFYIASIEDYAILNLITTACTHYQCIKNIAQITELADKQLALGRGNYRVFIKDNDYADTTEFKTFLQQQYAAGTPVTIWYVLAEPETAAVNEPLMKIGSYTDTLSNAASIPTTEGANSITVDTTVQPSEFTATWTGWHNASVKEYDGSDWN